MDDKKCKLNENSLVWYNKNKKRVSEKNKQKPKRNCIYCQREVYEYRFEEHISTNLHKRNYERFTNHEKDKKYNELKQKYDELMTAHNALKIDNNTLKNDNNVLTTEHNLIKKKYNKLKRLYKQLTQE